MCTQKTILYISMYIYICIDIKFGIYSGTYKINVRIAILHRDGYFDTPSILLKSVVVH